MSAKIRPDDWDRYFGPQAPRRGGPLRVLATTLSVGLACMLLVAAGVLGLRYRDRLQAESAALATANAQALATRAAEATATAEALRSTPTSQPPTPTVEPLLGRGSVLRGGNLRSAPRIVDDTVIGLIYPGDQVIFLEEQLVGGDSWFRIRVTDVAGDRSGGVGPGTEGWASSILLSPPTP